MSTVNGLPAHPLLVHFIVVLAPLTAVLAILCALLPAARERLVWLTLVLAGITAVLSPIASEAGEWLQHNIGESALVEKHAELGESMNYFAIALLVAALLLAIAHLRANRGKALPTALSAIVAVFVLAVSVASAVQVYRIGHSGAEATWGGVISATTAGQNGDRESGDRD